ncbi:MAG: tetratricopeptide repeat protein [Flavobacteriales bacterium]|nr:tetratricopeptide repeat protein [Flavobacteriales bacterium]
MGRSGLRHNSAKLRVCLAMLCLGTFTAGDAQDLDSLRSIWLDGQLPDSVRFAACHALAWDGYLFTAPDTAAQLAAALRTAATEKHSRKFVAVSWDLEAAVRYVKGDFQGAIGAYKGSLPIYRELNDSGGIADVLTNMAGMLSYTDRKDTALLLYDEGLSIHLAMGDSVSIANDLNSIGRVHMVRGDHARAADFFRRSLRIQENLKNDRGISTGLVNLGTLHAEQSDYAAALDYYQRALAIAYRLNDRHLIGKDLEEVGVCLEQMGDTADAMDHFQRSRAIREELGDAHGLVNVRNRIADLEYRSGHHTAALELYRANKVMAQDAELPWALGNALVGEGNVLLDQGRASDALVVVRSAKSAASDAEDVLLQRDVFDLEYRTLKALHRWEDALEAYTAMNALSDSIMREENQREVLRNEFRYAYETRAVTDSLQHAAQLEEEALRSEQRVDRERSARNLAIALVLLAVVVGSAIWQRARLLKRTNKTILQAQERLVESERAREASEVRTRIARDVHDQLGSDLTKLVLLSGESKAVSREDPDSLPGLTDEMERIAAAANRSLGDIVWAIDTEHDSLAGLTERVRAHCERMLGNSGISHHIDCAHDGPDLVLDPGTRRDVHMILREALNNALKHAQATHIDVLFHSSENRLKMEVRDDGTGHWIDGTPGGNGIRNMRQRAERCGARLEISTGNGTTVSMMLDLTNERPV